MTTNINEVALVIHGPTDPAHLTVGLHHLDIIPASLRQLICCSQSGRARTDHNYLFFTHGRVVVGLSEGERKLKASPLWPKRSKYDEGIITVAVATGENDAARIGKNSIAAQ